MSEQLVTLASIGDGACLQLFDHEFKRVIANIADPNTNGKAKREITIKITITPDEDRDVAAASVQVTSKLAHVKPVQSTMYFGKKDGRLVAVENNPKQSGIFDTPEQRQFAAGITPLSVVPSNKEGA